jgi:hypothetical protein
MNPPLLPPTKSRSPKPLKLGQSFDQHISFPCPYPTSARHQRANTESPSEMKAAENQPNSHSPHHLLSKVKSHTLHLDAAKSQPTILQDMQPHHILDLSSGGMLQPRGGRGLRGMEQRIGQDRVEERGSSAFGDWKYRSHFFSI